MNKSLATATLNDIWAGEVSSYVAPFKTSRKGEKVIRFRWQRVDGQSVGIWANTGFVTVAQAIAAASRHPDFSNIVEA